MTRNIGAVDRCIRLFLAAPAFIGVGLFLGPTSTASWVLYALAGLMVLTSAVGHCPTYRLLGLTTVGIGPRMCGRRSACQNLARL